MEVDLLAQEGERGGVEGSEIEDDREKGDKSELPDEGNTAGSEDTSMGENNVETSEVEVDTLVCKASYARKAPQ